MLKLFKWVYKLGKLHERRRIELLFKEHAPPAPRYVQLPPKSEWRDKEWNTHINQERDRAIHQAVIRIIEQITRPQPQEYKRKIDEEYDGGGCL